MRQKGRLIVYERKSGAAECLPLACQQAGKDPASRDRWPQMAAGNKVQTESEPAEPETGRRALGGGEKKPAGPVA